MEDEETSRTRAWRYLFGIVKVRGDLEGDSSHSLWNTMKAGLKTTIPNGSDLWTSMLKLSICANYSHGAFLSGRVF